MLLHFLFQLPVAFVNFASICCLPFCGCGFRNDIQKKFFDGAGVTLVIACDPSGYYIIIRNRGRIYELFMNSD